MEDQKRTQPNKAANIGCGCLMILAAAGLLIFGVITLFGSGKKALSEFIENLEIPSPDPYETADDAIEDVWAIEDGGIYSDLSGDFIYSIYKVIGTENDEVLLLKYEETFTQVPENIRTRNLTIDQAIKIDKQVFLERGMELVTLEPIRNSEYDLFD